MALGKHTRTPKGRIRRERSDSTAGTLRRDYPEFSSVRSDAKLGNIKRNLGLPPDAPINAVRKELRKINRQIYGRILTTTPLTPCKHGGEGAVSQLVFKCSGLTHECLQSSRKPAKSKAQGKFFLKPAKNKNSQAGFTILQSLLGRYDHHQSGIQVF